MGWFDEQIRQRIQNDEEIFADAHAKMESLVSSRNIQITFQADKKIAEKAVGDILRYYHVRHGEVPDSIREIDSILEYLFRPAGIMRRSVTLGRGWYKDAVGAMLGTRKDGKLVALIPDGFSGYCYQDYETDKKIRINSRTAQEIEETAICFYQPLPTRKLHTRDLFSYIFRMLRLDDYVLMVALALVITLVGMVTPQINRYLFGEVLEAGNPKILLGAVITLLCTMLSGCLFRVARDIWNANTGIRTGLALESAMMMRILSLPADFFKTISSGELASRMNALGEICSILFDAVLSTGMSALFSLIYIGQIFVYAPKLAGPALVVPLCIVAISVISAWVRVRVMGSYSVESSRESGIIYSMIGGIVKIKNAGAEKRAFGKWADRYVKAAEYFYQPPAFLKFNPVFITLVSSVGTVLIYYNALRHHVPVADYMAFNSAYGIVLGAFTSLAGVALSAAQIRPAVDMLRPVLDVEPEVSTEKQVVTRLNGGIELNNVSFRYQESMPYILDNVSVKIRPGQYVAVVGKTGCGKSTLLRLLLGFEKPERGAVYYDGRDLNSVDLKSLRRKIGVVLQNGKLFHGDIFSNISISAPNLTIEQAWEAAEMAGMAEDIRHMPMGMGTILTEGAGGISGGQRQRLLIARAIASKPRILMFDEATSALDNITQKIVSESLDMLKCTRIVIAHRLSTIRQCDRILVLDQGKIVEDGSYEELIAKGGVFAELVERQRG